MSAHILSLLLGVASSIIAAWVWAWVSPRLPVVSRARPASISGWWVGRIVPAYDPGREVLNLIRISERSGRVKIYLEHYNNRTPQAVKYDGIGVYYPPDLSAIYFHSDQFSSQSGVWVLRLRRDGQGNALLEGVYAHYVDRVGVDQPSARSEAYELRPVTLPMRTQLRILAGRCGFPDHASASALWNGQPAPLNRIA